MQCKSGRELSLYAAGQRRLPRVVLWTEIGGLRLHRADEPQQYSWRCPTWIDVPELMTSQENRDSMKSVRRLGEDVGEHCHWSARILILHAIGYEPGRLW